MASLQLRKAEAMQPPEATHAQRSYAPLLVSLVAEGIMLISVKCHLSQLHYSIPKFNLLDALLTLCPLDVIQTTLNFVEKPVAEPMAERRLESSKDYMSKIKTIIKDYLASELSPVVQPAAKRSTAPSSAAVGSSTRWTKFSLTRQIKKLAGRK
jgi:hypothetical protein